MENVKSRPEHPKGAERGLSPPPGTNQYPTPPGVSYPMRPVSDHMQFGNHTLWPSGEAAVTGSGLGRSLGLIPRNSPLEKVDEDGRGDLGVCVVDGI